MASNTTILATKTNNTFSRGSAEATGCEKAISIFCQEIKDRSIIKLKRKERRMKQKIITLKNEIKKLHLHRPPVKCYTKGAIKLEYPYDLNQIYSYKYRKNVNDIFIFFECIIQYFNEKEWKEYMLLVYRKISIPHSDYRAVYLFLILINKLIFKYITKKPIRKYHLERSAILYHIITQNNYLPALLSSLFKKIKFYKEIRTPNLVPFLITKKISERPDIITYTYPDLNYKLKEFIHKRSALIGLETIDKFLNDDVLCKIAEFFTGTIDNSTPITIDRYKLLLKNTIG